MRSSSFALACCFGVAFLLLNLAACRSSVPAQRALLVGRGIEAVTLDPVLALDIESGEVVEQIFEHLVRFRPGTREILPALAQSWSVSPDGLTWTFQIRRGVRFHDGTPLDADAVIFSLDRLRASDQKAAHYWDSAFPNIVRLEKIDPYQVRLVLKRPIYSLLSALAISHAAIVSPTAVRRAGHEFANTPVGTGPFRLVEWVRGERVTLAANRDYWGPQARIDHLVFLAAGSPRQRLVALQGGSIDVAEGLSPIDLQLIKLHPEIQVQQLTAANVVHLIMNTTHPPFDDARVRRAVSHAIYRTPILKLVYQGLAQEADGPLSPAIRGAIVQPKAYPHDPALARQLLAEALPTQAAPIKFLVAMSPRVYLPAPEQAGRIIASQLAQVGLKVEVIPLPIDEFFRATTAGEHDLCLSGWISEDGEAGGMLSVLFDSRSATNLARFNNARVDTLLENANDQRDPARQAALYSQVLEIIHQAAPLVPLVHSELALAQRIRVTGAALGLSSSVDFHEATIVEP